MSSLRIIHRGRPFMRGAGVGSVFKSLYSWLIPLFKTGAKSALKSGTRLAKSKVAKTIVKEAKKEIKKGGINALSEIIAGKDPLPKIKSDVGAAQAKISKAVKRHASNPTNGIVKKKSKSIAKKKRLTVSVKPRQRSTGDFW